MHSLIHAFLTQPLCKQPRSKLILSHSPGGGTSTYDLSVFSLEKNCQAAPVRTISVLSPPKIIWGLAPIWVRRWKLHFTHCRLVSFMKIRSAVPENSCLIVVADGKKTSVKHIRIRLIGGCVKKLTTLILIIFWLLCNLTSYPHLLQWPRPDSAQSSNYR